MSQLVSLPLESYLLAKRPAPSNCILCGHENSSSTERCRRCATPTAIARSCAKSKRRPKMIAVIGAPGAGKTVYLGMLMDMLVRHAGGVRATVCGPYSVGLQQETTTALASGYYPDNTSVDPEQWHWVHCHVECTRSGKKAELLLADVSGEAWRAEADRPGSFAALAPMLQQCCGVLILADAERLHAGDHADDFVALKLLSQLGDEQRENRKRAGRMPLALVFTKADGPQSCLEDPNGFAESHAAGLLRDCQSRYPNTRVFGASVVGASATRTVGNHRGETPLRVEPQGVVEPIGWLLTQIV